MAKTRLNVMNLFRDKKGQRRIGVLDTDTKKVLTSNGKTKSLKHYEKVDKNGVGFFETYILGKKVQNSGRYKMKKLD